MVDYSGGHYAGVIYGVAAGGASVTDDMIFFFIAALLGPFGSLRLIFFNFEINVLFCDL
jgi:hypothetical protein